MNKDAQFQSERMDFRGIRLEDAIILVKWRSDLELIQHFRNPRPITKEGHLTWFRDKYLKDSSRYDFIVQDRKTGKEIGTVGIKEWVENTCQISYMIAESAYQRQGFAREAILALMKTMEGEGVTRFFALIHPGNEASIRTVKGIGYTFDFEEEGFLYFVWIRNDALFPC